MLQSLAPAYASFSGTLFQYSQNPSLVAFESLITSSNNTPLLSPCPNKCILIGGLSDGLIPLGYTAYLEKKCHQLGWSLVQPILSSSYLGFGSGSLNRDTNEISKLLLFLKENRCAEQFAIIGHSTGCQNAIHLLKHGEENVVKDIKFISLQAPVSDREVDPEMKDNKYLNIAKNLNEQGKEQEMMPRDAFWAPITVYRFLSLHDVKGDDDFFSSDFTNEEFLQILGHVGKLSKLKVLVAFSGKDEYVPQQVNKENLLQNICRAMNHYNTGYDIAFPLFLENANHNLSSNKEDSKMFVDEVGKYLQSVTSSQNL